MVVNVGHRRVLVLMSASQIHFAIKRQIDLHILQKVLIGGLELIKPLQNMLFDDEEAVEHLDWCGEVILRPFVYVGHVNDDPVVFEGVHGCVGQDHRLASASQSTHKHALA